MTAWLRRRRRSDTRWRFVPNTGRVPLLHQDTQVECGAACLAMMLTFYGRHCTVAEAHERCRVGRDGVTARDIREAALSYGLRAQAFRLERLDPVRSVAAPAVLHWDGNHFVVLERLGRRWARIVNPAHGRQKIEHQEFLRRAGLGLTFEPGPEFKTTHKRSDDRPGRILANQALRAPAVRRLLTLVLAASMVLQVLGLAVPLLTALVVDHVLPHPASAEMTVLGLGVMVIVMTNGMTSYVRGLLLVSLSSRLDAQLMSAFLEHLFALPYRYFQSRPSGDILQRFASNAQVRAMLSVAAVSAMLDGLLVIVYAIILVTMAPPLGLTVLVLGTVQLVVIILTKWAMTTRVTAELEKQADAQAFIIEALSNIGSIKASGAEGPVLANGTTLLLDQVEATLKRSSLSVFIGSITSTIQGFSALILLLIGATLVLDGSMTLGFMLAMVSLAGNFLGPLANLVLAGTQLQQVGGYLRRIARVFQEDPEQPPGEQCLTPSLRGEIEFDDVSFRYDAASPWVLRHLSLRVEPGQKVALVGPTGSGKSTVAKLILGLHEPTQGEIRLDGHGLRRFHLPGVRAQCGVVMQEAAVFNRPMRDNISYFTKLPDAAVERAARFAEFDEDVQSMRMGYNTMAGEAGSELSGGQRQRLAIARALARQPRLLIFDEATSQLDMATEARIAQRLSELRCTSIVVAHRLSTVRDADVILVLDGGEVVEQGSHDHLMANGGLYAELARGQLLQHGASEVS